MVRFFLLKREPTLQFLLTWTLFANQKVSACHTLHIGRSTRVGEAYKVSEPSTSPIYATGGPKLEVLEKMGQNALFWPPGENAPKMVKNHQNSLNFK